MKAKTSPISIRLFENDLILAQNKSGITKPQKLIDFLLSEYVRDLKPQFASLPKDFVDTSKSGISTVDSKGKIKPILPHKKKTTVLSEMEEEFENLLKSKQNGKN